MAKRVWVGCLLVAMFQPIEAYDITPWAQVLKTYVNDEGEVNYKGLKENPQALNQFVVQLAQTGPTTTPSLFKTRADSLTFWINAYNALVIFGVQDVYPVNSVEDILPDFGFFNKKMFQVDGQYLTLDDIEHKILRPQFQDPRIHAALNCAAKSCPKLHREPFRAAQIDSQLQSVMRHMIQSGRHVNLNEGTEIIYLSKIFQWFQSDFVSWLKQKAGLGDPTVLDYVKLFATPTLNQKLSTNPKIVFNAYDWTLNDQRESH